MWFWASLSWSNSAEWIAMYKWFDLSCFLFPSPSVSFSPNSVWADAKGVSREHVLFVNNWMLLLPLLLYLHLLIPVSLSPAASVSSAFSFVTPSRHSCPPDFKRDSRCSFGVFFLSLLSSVADSHVNVWRPCSRAVASKNPPKSETIQWSETFCYYRRLEVKGGWRVGVRPVSPHICAWISDF